MPKETALIIGASSGIGWELAKLFAADKSDLVLVARSEEKLQHFADELRRNHGVEVIVLRKDLADFTTPQAIFDELAAGNIPVDILVNNAGFGAVGPVATLPLEKQLKMIQVNLTSLTHLTRLFLPGMIERGRGGILNVGSTAAFQPGPNMAVYYATKAFVLSFTEALAEELAGTPLKVTCLAPGPTATGFGAVSGMDNSFIFKLGAMKATAVAQAGYRGFRRGKAIVIPGFTNRLAAFSVRLGLRSVVRKIAMRLNRSNND
jgi:uncharacterized protein